MLCEPLLLFFVSVIAFIILVIKFKTDNILVASAGGAFFGTAAAFLLNISYLKMKTKLKNISSLRKSEYLIEKILKNNIEIKSDMDKYLTIANGTVYDWEKIRRYEHFFPIPEIQIKDLTFLVDHHELGKETLDSILLVNAENLSVIHILEERNYKYAFYLDRTETASYSTKEDLEKIISKRLCIELESLTERLKSLNSNLLEDCRKAKNKIEKFLYSY